MARLSPQKVNQSGPVRLAPAPVAVQHAPTAARSEAAPLHSLQAHQSAYGNQAVQRLLESRAVQAKLTVTPPSDAYEQEAEQVAHRVLHTEGPSAVSEAAPQVHRLPVSVSRAGKDDKKKPPAGKEGGGTNK